MQSQLCARGALSWIAAFGLGLSSVAAHADTLAEESFTPSFPVYASGGEGFVGAWEMSSPEWMYRTGGDTLCHKNLQCCVGSSVSSPARANFNWMRRELATPLTDGDTFYFSFLLEPRGTLHEGGFNGFFGGFLGTEAFPVLFVGKPGGGAADEYVMEMQGGAGQVSSGVEASVGQTALLVVKAQLQPGNDVFTLYVNPTPLQREPSSGAIKADLDVGAVTHIGAISSGAFAIDELRIGTSWDDVVPVAQGGAAVQCAAP